MIIDTADYLTVPQIAKLAGSNLIVVHRWLTYYRYMNVTRIFERPMILRSEFEKFRVEHAELFQNKTT